jgi:uncharacterized protein YndB with AHSA1/START domain
MASFTLERHVAAPPETVFAVLTEHDRYDAITPLRKSVLEREGDPPPNGVGAIRVMTSVGPPLREKVVAYEPPTRFSYTVISGAPIRDHLGTVELAPEAGGTRIVYAVRMIPTLPLAGAAVVGAIRLGIGMLLRGVKRESERRAAADG